MLEKFKESSIWTKISIGITLVLLIIFVVVMLSMTSSVNAANNAVEKNKQLVNELSQQYNNISEYKETVESVKTTLVSAASAGNAVADLQNQYGSLVKSDKTYATSVTTIASSMDKYLDKDSSNARVPWFSTSMSNMKWTFNTTYSVDATSIDCLWTCYSDKNELVGYVTGTYDVGANIFSDMDIHMTSIGTSYLTAKNVAPNNN